MPVGIIRMRRCWYGGHPTRLSRSAHAALCEDWFAALSRHCGSEILAVQTLHKSLMSATHDRVAGARTDSAKRARAIESCRKKSQLALQSK
jgi:hypothetical protein